MKTMKFRRTLLMLLLLTLTMSAVTGGTIAWFTDSVESDKNVITSGNLDIELDYWDGDSWETVADKSDILTNTLWEPGVAEIAYLKVKNAGSLALKYRLGVNIANEIAGTNVKDEPFNLSDHIEFGMVEGVNGETNAYSKDAAGRAKAIAAVTEAKKLASGYTKFAAMNAGDPDQYIALVVYMPTTVGNEANHKTGTPAPTIDLGIKVEATQLVAESDSFGNDYDENAWGSWNDVADAPTPDENGVVTVSTAEELAGVMRKVDAASGIKTINIVRDINLGGRKWAPAYVSAPDLVINGNGNTISNMTTNEVDYQGFIGVAYQNITINDLTFKNATVKANRSFDGTVIGWAWGNANVVFNNVDVIDSDVSATLPNKAIRVGGLIGFFPSDGGTLTLKDCDVTGCTITGYHNVGAMVGTTLTQKTVTIENCTAKKNTLKYGSPNVGAFDFGASTSGYTAYVPASGFTAEDNVVSKVAEVTTTDDLKNAISDGANEIILGAGEFTADFYSLTPNRKLTITGQGAATKLNFANQQVRLELFDELTISNCTMGRMLGKSWGQLVFGSSTQAGGKYTISNCIFNGESTQGIYINQMVPATFNIENCTFNGDFGGEGAITIQNNENVNITVNVTDCSFNNIPATSHEIYLLYNYHNCTLNVPGVKVDMANVVLNAIPAESEPYSLSYDEMNVGAAENHGCFTFRATSE